MRGLVIAIAAVAALGLLVPSAPEAATVDEVKFVAKEMACLCGSCPRRPLDECNCGFAGSKREEIAKLLDQGQDKEAIIASFVSREGLQVLAVPPAEGFNLSAWIMPFAVLLCGGLVVVYVIRTWSHARAARQKASPSAPEPADDDPYRSRLESDLRDRDL